MNTERYPRTTQWLAGTHLSGPLRALINQNLCPLGFPCINGDERLSDVISNVERFLAAHDLPCTGIVLSKREAE